MGDKVAIDRQDVLDKIEELNERLVRLKNILAAIDVVQSYYDDENGEDFGD